MVNCLVLFWLASGWFSFAFGSFGWFCFWVGFWRWLFCFFLALVLVGFVLVLFVALAWGFFGLLSVSFWALFGLRVRVLTRSACAADMALVIRCLCNTWE